MPEIIAPDDFLLRRIPFTDPNYIRDDNTVTSFAFKSKKNQDGLSVNLERLTDYQKSIQDRTRFRLYKLKVEFVLSLGDLDVKHNPQPDNYAHCLITGNITNSKASAMSRAAQLNHE